MHWLYGVCSCLKTGHSVQSSAGFCQFHTSSTVCMRTGMVLEDSDIGGVSVSSILNLSFWLAVIMYWLDRSTRKWRRDISCL